MFIERDRDKGWIRLSQNSYVSIILKRFGMSNRKSTKTQYSTERCTKRRDNPKKLRGLRVMRDWRKHFCVDFSHTCAKGSDCLKKERLLGGKVDRIILKGTVNR